MRFWQFFILMVAVTALTNQARAWTCPSEAATVQVTPVTGEIQLDRSKSTHDLTHMQAGGAIRDGHHVNGLGGGSIGLEGRASFKILQRGQRACIWLQSINARFFAYPSIHIARNFPRGSCEYSAVLEHEMKHVDALIDFHTEYTGIFERELQLIAKRIYPKGPIPAAHIENTQDQMNDRISREIKSFNDRILPILEQRQNAIDTPEEYARVTAQCRNWHRYY